MRVISVNLGLPVAVPYRTTSLPTTAMAKSPVEGPVRITATGVEGNECADRVNHGDEFMRVYAYAVEDYAWWASADGGGLGRQPGPGHFGEQVTTEGVDLHAALVGEVWRVGTAVLQIAHVRIPCQTFKGWMGHTGYDETAWVRRFTQAGRPGPYFRVRQEGTVAAGDPIEVLERPDHGVTVADLFAAVTLRPQLLPRLLGVPGLKPWIYERAAEHRGRPADTDPVSRG